MDWQAQDMTELGKGGGGDPGVGPCGALTDSCPTSCALSWLPSGFLRILGAIGRSH